MHRNHILLPKFEGEDICTKVMFAIDKCRIIHLGGKVLASGRKGLGICRYGCQGLESKGISGMVVRNWEMLWECEVELLVNKFVAL